ncbi:dihydrofolate reductase family protein [Brevibacterium sp. S111]|uniref:dihydrofolate reductase family protein n=1 Tax=Brevibacterium sp. S111 TaxID=2483795 RepID=UPI0010820AF0|nr:dihydrofolate reductase family protein [Brevibacterium sp. S111]TGD12809.1 deaminase [Brevibacterium sp. S111]
MGELRYSINVTVDGCCDHRVGVISEEFHRHHAENLKRADGLVFGRVTYQMMEDAWRRPPGDTTPEADLDPFVEAIDPARKYVVSSTLDSVDWNSELIRGDLDTAIRGLKERSVTGLAVGGVTLPLALAELGLIDEFEFVIHPCIAGHGPYLFAGLSEVVDLELVGRDELESGHAILTYRLKQSLPLDTPHDR